MLRVRDIERIIDRDRNTILRWEREGKIPHPQKDSRGWRYYTEQDIQVLLNFMKKNNPYYDISLNTDSILNSSMG